MGVIIDPTLVTRSGVVDGRSHRYGRHPEWFPAERDLHEIDLQFADDQVGVVTWFPGDYLTTDGDEASGWDLYTDEDWWAELAHPGGEYCLGAESEAELRSNVEALYGFTVELRPGAVRRTTCMDPKPSDWVAYPAYTVHATPESVAAWAAKGWW